MFNSVSGTVFRDVLTLAVAGFIAIIILLLPWVQEPGKDARSDLDAPGSVIAEISWDAELDMDVDLWVQAPGDAPVGYSNKGGVSCNLLRDDLGHKSDPMKINHEITVCRKLVPLEEYTVNLHVYRASKRNLPVVVNVRLSLKKPGSTLSPFLNSTVPLETQGQEKTVARFKLTKELKFDSDSLHSNYKPLRSGSHAP